MISRRINFLLTIITLVFYGCMEIQKPNFIFILVDDLGWKDLGSYGSEFYESPNIDHLANQGMKFTNAYAASPVCSPTRASIQTGKHPVRIGITDWIPGRNPKDRKLSQPEDIHQLPLEEITLAEAMRDNGYRTFFAGKWHLGDDGFFPEDQGFDINKGGHHKGSPPGGYYAPYNNPRLTDGPEGEYLPDRLTDESIHFLEQSQQVPFFLFLSYYTVHTPIQACKRHLAYFQEKAKGISSKSEQPLFLKERDGWTKQRQDDPAYASMIYALDENIGRLLNALEKLDLDKNTIIIFMSDNGGLSTLGQEWAPTSNLPLRAGKGWCYEGGIREPMIIKAPGTTRAGSTCNEPVISHDFYPTILELAGLPVNPKQHVDGISLLPLLNGDDHLNREALFWHYPHYHGSMWTPGGAIRFGEWKLIEFFEENKIELYNLNEDIGEINNLAEKMPEKALEIKSRLDEWRTRMNAKMPVVNTD